MKRRGRAGGLAAALLLLATSLCGFAGAAEDFMALAAGWNPSACWLYGAVGTPCTQAPWATFGIKALASVSADDIAASPVWCKAPPFELSQLNKTTTDALACWAPGFKEGNEALWSDMWGQYGSCSEFKTPEEYFNFTLNAAAAYDANAVLATLSSQCADKVSTEDLQAALKDKFGKDAWITCNAEYPDQLLTVEVCLTRNETDNAPVAVDCPERRNWKLADGVQCGDSVAIMKGIVPPTCQTPKSPCNSVPSLPSDCSKVEVIESEYAVADFKVDYGVNWEDIAWLNPTVPLDSTTVPNGTTICLQNGPTPTGLQVTAEDKPPIWLPPWSDIDQRNASIYAACSAGSPSAAYVEGTLCLTYDSPQGSEMLGATLGGGLSGSCNPVCVYNPDPKAGDTVVVAWLFDYDNDCWMQVSRPTAPNACPLDSKGDASVQASAELLRNQKMMVEFLAGNTLNASDLQPNYSGIVTDAWAAFYESECGADDPTCGSAHEQLGRLLTDGFAANSTGEALVNLPADSPLGLLQAQLNETYRISDCERANATNFTSAACLCNGTIPYLHCNALAALESAASIETALRNNVITVDPASIKPAQLAQCKVVSSDKSGAPLDTSNQQAVFEFVTAPGEDPSSCCITAPVTPDSSVNAVICLTPTENVSQQLNDDPITKAASYTMPTCNYEDPLKQLTATDLQEALDWAVTVDTKFCLKGGAAVAELSKLAPWFGEGVTVEGDQLCAANLSTSYAPLKAYNEAGLGVRADADTGVLVSLGGYMDYKLLDITPFTPACVGAGKSASLNDLVACADYCLLNQWSWQGISWTVTSGSDVFGWSKKYDVLDSTKYVTPECNNNTFFKDMPPPCPPPPPTPIAPPPPPPSPPPPAVIVGDKCADQGPTNLFACCKKKAADGVKDTSCPPMSQLCEFWPPESLAACCADKALSKTYDKTCPGTTPPVGQDCASQGPTGFYTCCANKAKQGKADASCLPLESSCNQWPAESQAACCADKRAQRIVDSTCPQPPPVGSTCSSQGPANLYTCCAAKAAKGEYDASCPSMTQQCSKWPPASVAACCADKQARGVPDSSCPPVPPPIGQNCASQGPANFFNCCQQKAETGQQDTSCPNIEGPCDAFGASKTDCCAYKKQTGVFDPTCPLPDVCGSLPDAQLATCCTAKSQANVFDPSCPIGGNCGSLNPKFLTQCCAQKLQQGSFDPTCPIGGSCGSLPPQNFATCCAQKNQQGVNDPSCNGQIGADCSSQPPANRDQCCAQKEAQGIDDPACPNTLNPNGITPK